MPLKRVPDLLRFDTAKLQKINLFENSRFFCDVYCLLPGQEQVPHTHADEDKIYHVLSGEVVFREGNEDIPGTSGDTLWAKAGEVHGVRNPGPDNATLLVFMARG